VTRKTAQKTGGFPLKSLVFLLLSLMVFFVAVDRQDLPAGIADHEYTTAYYTLREGILNKNLPKKKERVEKGYSDKEREKMETLINDKAE
jgi:hypothetical protein